MCGYFYAPVALPVEKRQVSTGRIPEPVWTVYMQVISVKFFKDPAKRLFTKENVWWSTTSTIIEKTNLFLHLHSGL
jgi:hypothetical protein